MLVTSSVRRHHFEEQVYSQTQEGDIASADEYGAIPAQDAHLAAMTQMIRNQISDHQPAPFAHVIISTYQFLQKYEEAFASRTNLNGKSAKQIDRVLYPGREDTMTIHRIDGTVETFVTYDTQVYSDWVPKYQAPQGWRFNEKGRTRGGGVLGFWSFTLIPNTT